MIDTPARKGDLTREKCLAGAKGLLAGLERRLSMLRSTQATKTIAIEFNSANGVISAVESETRRAVPHENGLEPDVLLAEILDELTQLALPACHRAIRIEIVSVKGALSAIDTGTLRHRWDI
jgi:hypothetical protein